MRFCTSLNLAHDGDYCLASAPLEARHYVLACFTIALIQGDTIKGGHVKHATLNGYVLAVVALHKDRNLPSPRMVDKDIVGLLLTTVKKYEKVPNRREMIYDAMVANMLTRVSATFQKDSKEAAILDWIILGRYTGFRQAEWCQTSQVVAYTTPSLAHTTPEPLAFLPSDFVLFDPNECPCTNLLDEQVDAVEITWRFQKNGNNGERIPYKRDYDNPQLCPVSAAARILQRAQRLGVPPTHPLAVYASSSHSGGFAFITANNTADFLRSTAMATYNLPMDSPRLQRWSCHSIRVTAANLLHRANRSDSYIQTRLRWKSSTFLMYLRNTFYAADQHTAAMRLSDRNLPPLLTDTGTPIPTHRGLEEHEKLIASTTPSI